MDLDLEQIAGQLEGLALPQINEIMFIFFISGMVSWGGVQILKHALIGYLKAKHIVKPWWHDSVLRATSVILGGIAGYMISSDFSVILLGISGGALNAFAVTIFKIFLKKKVQ